MDKSICKKCGETPRASTVCELKAMPGMDKRCAFTGEIVEADRKKD